MSQTRYQTHHALAHIAVQRKIGGQRHQTLGLFKVANLEPRGPHRNTQGFSLIAARNGAAVVVGQHHHRPRVQTGAKHALTRHVKVIAVDQGVHVKVPVKA